MTKKSKTSKKGSAKKAAKTSSKKSKKAKLQKEPETTEHFQAEEQAQAAASISTDTTPETTPKAEKAASGKDENGFTIGSKSSLIYSLLAEGKHTREEILEVLNEKYPGANNKSSLSTFISDVQKPVGTYSSSRGVRVGVTEEGLLFIEK